MRFHGDGAQTHGTRYETLDDLGRWFHLVHADGIARWTQFQLSAECALSEAGQRRLLEPGESISAVVASRFLQVTDAQRVVDVLLSAASPVVGARFTQNVRVAVAFLERQRVPVARFPRQHLERHTAQPRGRTCKLKGL